MEQGLVCRFKLLNPFDFRSEIVRSLSAAGNVPVTFEGRSKVLPLPSVSDIPFLHPASMGTDAWRIAAAYFSPVDEVAFSNSFNDEHIVDTAGDTVEHDLVALPASVQILPGPVPSEVAEWGAIYSMAHLSLKEPNYPRSLAPVASNFFVVFGRLDDEGAEVVPVVFSSTALPLPIFASHKVVSVSAAAPITATVVESSIVAHVAAYPYATTVTAPTAVAPITSVPALPPPA